MSKSKIYNIDLWVEAPITIPTVQLDNDRIIRFKILENKADYDLTDKTAKYYIRKAGETIWKDCIIKNGLIEVPLTSDGLEDTGTVELQLEINSETGKVKSFVLYIYVSEDISTNSIASVDETKAFEKAFNDLLVLETKVDSREFDDEGIQIEYPDLLAEVRNLAYQVKKNDDIQEVLKKNRVVYFPPNVEFNMHDISTGMDNQIIYGNKTIIKNDSAPSKEVGKKISTLKVYHRNVLIKDLILVGKQSLDKDTNTETIATGHHIIINTLGNANLQVEGVVCINGYNGITIQNGASKVKLLNCITQNCEHGVQLYNCSDVLVENHTHIVAPYGDSLGYSQRSIKIQRGCKNITLRNLDLEGGRICGIYFRNEIGDILDIDNITLDNVRIKFGVSSVSGYKTYTGIYFEHDSNNVLNNITLNEISIDGSENGIVFKTGITSPIENLTIKNLTTKNLVGGRTITYKDDVSLSRLNLENIKGNGIKLKANNSFLNYIDLTTNDFSLVGTNNVKSNITYNNTRYRDEIAPFSVPNILIGESTINGFYKFEGRLDGSGNINIPYPNSWTKDNTCVISAKYLKTNNTYSNLGYALGSSIMIMGNSTSLANLPVQVFCIKI